MKYVIQNEIDEIKPYYKSSLIQGWVELHSFPHHTGLPTFFSYPLLNLVWAKITHGNVDIWNVIN